MWVYEQAERKKTRGRASGEIIVGKRKDLGENEWEILENKNKE